MGDPRWRLWAVAVVAVTVAAMAEASKFPDRRASSACTLRAVKTEDLLDRNCQIESVLGEEKGENEGAGVLKMSFGEENCTLELTNCVPGMCYSIIDETFNLERDGIPRKQPSSFFSSVSFAGAKDVSHTPRGVAFRSEQKKIVLTYSTHTCSDFYWYHGREKHQLCRAPYGAIRTVEAGAPFALPCKE
ncbi:hypothetical protein HOP50_06g42500 [Chloropicon primus]|uniref:Uncharacterized protein n=1 Tax=Chloropicon primus TaxID=1764295 RepID=A0A5B8MM27_9CHLO|nr:hypothetical protein A3770_06p42260 [Chloropicon primus]UPR00929.1 hypothetical protein HOP50_06g42500 [Chloropicon primus]|eukprot:QDZ21708.1 hypothetical protein A3770_06p42260 [Chloropicon primus]